MDTKGHILENQTICLRQRDKGVLQKGVCLSGPKADDLLTSEVTAPTRCCCFGA